MSVAFTTYFGTGFVADPMFEAMFFPAGEAHVKVLEDKIRTDVGDLTQVARIDSADANELMQVAMWADACGRRGEKTVLFMPYMPAARADHEDEPVFGAQVYADLINSMFIDQIIVFDPHSPIMPDLIQRGLTVIDSTRLVRQHVVGHADYGIPQRYEGIIAPDKGAVRRAAMVAQACHLPLYLAEKHRNPDTGKLSDFTCEPLPEKGRFLVVDDICDGGGTFMGLANTTGVPMHRLGLFVSHGVFSGAAQNLLAYYKDIWTTDSLGSANIFATKQNMLSAVGERVHVIPLAKTLKGYIR